MPFIESSSSTPSEEEIVNAALRRVSTGNGYIQLPSSSQILERLYNDHGVRIRMVRRNRPRKIPTVRELIDQLSKKHERLLEIQAKGAKIEKHTIKDGRRVSLESLTDYETPRDSTKNRSFKYESKAPDNLTDHDKKILDLFPKTDKGTKGSDEFKRRLDPVIEWESKDAIPDMPKETASSTNNNW